LLRFTITEQAHAPLPPLDLADAERIVVGSGPDAHVRLPASVARAAHVELARGAWTVIAAVVVDGQARAPGDHGAIGDGLAFQFGACQVAVAPAPPGVAASPPQRTESLARELVRGLLGDGAAPALEVVEQRAEVGAIVGARRALAPPESTLVIGRGDEAGWTIADEDLSRAHAEIRHGWDGITLVDLESKNGTEVDGRRVTGRVVVRDGARIALGALVLRFDDPAERHLRAAPEVVVSSSVVVDVTRRSERRSLPFTIAVAIATLAVIALGYVLAT